MKKIAVIVFVVCVVIGLCLANFFSSGRVGFGMPNFSFNFGGGVKGSGNATTEKRNVAAFDSVDVSGVFQVEIVAGKDFSVEVQADDNIVPLVTTEVQGNTLHIGLEKKVDSRSGLIVRISAPDIKKIESSGVSKINAAGIKNDAFAIDLSGASKLTVSGETAKFKVDLSGAGKVDAENLKAVDADVDASGACSVSLNVSGSLKTEASGASHITYTGDPTSVDNHQSGAGRVSKK